MRTAAVLALLAALSWSPRTIALDVAGTVLMSGKSPVKDAVVTIEGTERSKPLAHAMVDQRHKAFIPHVSIITVGTTVEFPNNDTVFHNVFAAYNAKKFDLGLYAHGKVKRQTFSKPGLVALMCNIHSSMSAYILVVDTPYYAVTDDKGRFVVHGVPPGEYKLHVWHESGAVTSRSIHLGADSTPLSINLERH